MTKPNDLARNFIQKSFSPCIAILSNPLVNEICHKNNLSFIELLEPFCVLDKEVSFLDPSGNTVFVNNIRINLSNLNSKPPEAATAKRLLNESLSTDVDNIEMTTIQSGNISVQIPTTVPWFEKWRETFFDIQSPSDHEFTKHFIACIIVISSREENPMDTLSNMVQQLQQTLSVSPPKMMPKWFSSSILRYYLLIHDNLSNDVKMAEKVFEEMKLMYNSQCCHMLQINSANNCISDTKILHYWKKFRKDVQVTKVISTKLENTTLDGGTITGNSKQLKGVILDHPLSPELEKQRSLMNDNGDDLNDEVDHCYGVYLTDEDIIRIRNLVSSFIISALIPFVETQMQYLNEMVQNKKGVSKSIFSATKRLLGAKASSTTQPNVHYYHPDSPELQMRRLGDLCFMFGAYHSAFHAYHSSKRDFFDDGALLYYAGAVEMASLSAFLIGQDIKKAQEYAEESINIYLNKCRMPQHATRLTLCATECLKSLNMYGEAAGHLLQLTCKDSDLRSALLLEEASYCFVKSRKLFMPRKYAFHLVLAGHRFSKANQKRHSLRCYRQAYQVYEDKNWSLADDHIHFTIGKLASALKQREITAAEFAKLFEKPSSQFPAEQASFLKEYLLSLIELQKECKEFIPHLQVPRIDHSSIIVTLNSYEKTENKLGGSTLAGKTLSKEELSDKRWWKLEEQLISYTNSGILPINIKPTINVLTNDTSNISKPMCVVNEKIRVNVDLVNELNIPFALREVKLMWSHSAEASDPASHRNSLVETEVIDWISIDPESRNNVSLHICPKIAGEIKVTGIAYTVAFSSVGNAAESINISGCSELKPRGKKIISIKTRKTSDFEYAPDYRLQMLVIQDAPRLKVYFKDLPCKMLCGEVKKMTVSFENVGSLPVKRVFLTSSEANLFSTERCKSGNVLPLYNDIIEPGQIVEVLIFLRGCDISGRVSIDLLFFYDTVNPHHLKVKYRLIHHTIHLLIHESLFSSVTAIRSFLISHEDKEIVNFKIHIHNKNQVYDTVVTKIGIEQISLYSSNWKICGVISLLDNCSFTLEDEESVFLIIQAEREDSEFFYSDLSLCQREEKKSSAVKPLYHFMEPAFNEILQNNESQENNKQYYPESAVTINSVLIIFWKAELHVNNCTSTAIGVHHIPVLKLGSNYTSVSKNLWEICTPSLINFPFSSLYYNSLAHELTLIRLQHPVFVSHSFSVNKICCVPVDVFVQNCSSHSIDLKVDAACHVNNNPNKINESSIFLWLGLVLQTFTVPPRSSVKIPLIFCVGNVGTFDMAAQLTVSARKTNSNDVFVAQSSIQSSLICVTNDD